jgi:hypothetical protein
MSCLRKDRSEPEPDFPFFSFDRKPVPGGTGSPRKTWQNGITGNKPQPKEITMTAAPSMTAKLTATTVLLAGVGILALGYVLHLVQQPPAGAGWRHAATVAMPAALVAPAPSRGSNAEGTGLAGAGDTTTARGRN